MSIETDEGRQYGDVMLDYPVTIDESDPLYWLEVASQEYYAEPEATENVFCPTGPGGGVDPSCSPGTAGRTGQETVGRETFGRLKISDFPSPKDVEIVKSLPGSTGPKLVKDKNGKLWVMKQDSPQRLENELSADNAYRALGIRVPESATVSYDGKTWKMSEYLEGENLKAFMGHATPEEREKITNEIQKGFVADALLANWDVIGLTEDNILIHDGHAYRIDNGGALAYRAQGTPKGEKFNKNMDELQTMRDASLNPQAWKYFKDLTPSEITAQMHEVSKKGWDVLKTIYDPVTRGMISQRLDTINKLLYPDKTSKVLTTAPVPKAPKVKKPALPVPMPPANMKQMTSEDMKSGEALVKFIKENSALGWTKLQLDKVLHLNPQGLQGGVFKTFYAVSSQPATTAKLKGQLEELKVMLPPGTKIQRVNLTAAKMGIGPGETKVVAATKAMTKGLDDVSVHDAKLEHIEAIQLENGVSPDKSMEESDKNLTTAHKYALASWVDGGYKDIRKFVIGVGSGQYIANTVKNFLDALSKLPYYTGLLYRGIHGPHASAEMQAIAKAGVGGIWIDKAPMSTSTKASVGWGFSSGKLLLKIHSKTGRAIRRWGISDEYEAVGMAGVNYRILKITKNAKIKFPKTYYGQTTEHTVAMLVEVEEI
jgi:hypothetical protein